MKFIINYVWLTGFLITVVCSCTEVEKNPIVSRTPQMVQLLDSIVANGAPTMYFNWNSELADFLAPIYTDGSVAAPGQLHFEYWLELLRAGETKKCIILIETYLDVKGQDPTMVISSEYEDVVSLLALAYFKMDERENLMVTDNSRQFIIPMQREAIQKMTNGSQNAIIIYTALFDNFHKNTYKWMLNLAYMRIGKYPIEVPIEYVINLPDSIQGKNNFPEFSEIATTLGIAKNDLAGGTSVDDFNGDGYIDIFVTSFGLRDQAKLFLNDKKGGFYDATEAAGLSGLVGGINVKHVDYDNDGDNDLLILRGGWYGKNGNHPNSLLRNNGNGFFEDITQAAGLLNFSPSVTAAWADFDKDGFLDVFIGNEGGISNPNPSGLFHNNGDGTFSEVSRTTGIGTLDKWVTSADWGDIDNDGWPELFVSIKDQNNLFFKNRNGNFEEIGSNLGLQKPRNSSVSWFWDVNNDGFEDLFVCGYYTENLHENITEDYAKELQELEVWTPKPKLYLNNGNGSFQEKAPEYNISRSMYGLGGNYGDLNNDGYLDFYMGTGSVDVMSVVPNRVFKNNRGVIFDEVTYLSGLSSITKGSGVAFADFDRDGDLDIYTVTGGGMQGDNFRNAFFENHGNKNNWIVIELEGLQTNRSAIGTRIKLLLDDGREIYRTVKSEGANGSSSLQQEIGIGSSHHIVELEITWLNSSVQKIKDVGINQKIKIKEDSKSFTILPYEKVPINS